MQGRVDVDAFARVHSKAAACVYLAHAHVAVEYLGRAGGVDIYLAVYIRVLPAVCLMRVRVGDRGDGCMRIVKAFDLALGRRHRLRDVLHRRCRRSLFRRGQLSEDVYIVALDINTAVGRRDVSVYRRVAVHVDFYISAVEVRAAAEVEGLAFRAVHRERAVGVERASVISRACVEFVKRQAAAVDGEARVAPAPERFPVERDIAVRLRVDDCQQRIRRRAVLYAADAHGCQCIGVFAEILFRVRQEGVQYRHRAVVDAPAFFKILRVGIDVHAVLIDEVEAVEVTLGQVVVGRGRECCNIIICARLNEAAVVAVHFYIVGVFYCFRVASAVNSSQAVVVFCIRSGLCRTSCRRGI